MALSATGRACRACRAVARLAHERTCDGAHGPDPKNVQILDAHIACRRALRLMSGVRSFLGRFTKVFAIPQRCRPTSTAGAGLAAAAIAVRVAIEYLIPACPPSTPN